MSQGLVHVLAEPGHGRDTIEETIASLDWAVQAGRLSEPLPPETDVLMLDGRGADPLSATGVVDDHRPMVAILDGPSGLADALRRRSAPTLVMAGYDPSGLRVALATCAALRPTGDREVQRLAAAS